MDRVLMPELIDGVKQCSKNGVKGFIVQSHKPNIFCAGLDIRQLHNKPREEMEDFWHLLQDSWFTLYNLDQPMVAAVNGAAIAGGCLIACTADRRLMLKNTKGKIGYSAPMLGMVTPTFVMSTFQSIVGTREAELALGTARLYNAEQAHNAGLIDILAESPEELYELARREVEQMIKIPFQARAITKKLIRGPLLKEFLKTRDENTKWGIDQLLDPDTQNVMGKYLASLGKK